MSTISLSNTTLQQSFTVFRSFDPVDSYKRNFWSIYADSGGFFSCFYDG